MVVAQAVANERVRGPNLAVFRTRANGAPFEKVVPEVDEMGLVIAPSIRLSKAILSSDEWVKIKTALACHAGTHTAYVEPNTVFEKTAILINDLEKIVGTRYFVEYLDSESKKRWLFPVHPEFLGKQNAILVAEHPNYKLHVHGNNIITLPAGMSLKEAVDLVPDFPGSPGWYKGDPKHHIPVLREDGQELYLSRIARRVGSAVRGIFFGDGVYLDARQDVSLFGRPSSCFGVVVEAAK